MQRVIDQDELDTCLRVLKQAEQLPVQHPDAVTIRRAVGGLFKAYKQARRVERRERVSAADRAVIGATATGSANRVDDETAGIPLVSSVPGALAGWLIR